MNSSLSQKRRSLGRTDPMAPLADGFEIVINGPGQAILTSAPCPALTNRQIRVRVERTLISPGTELALYEGSHSALSDPEVRFAKYPFRPGYAAIGTVDWVGEDVIGVAEGLRIFFHGRHSSWGVLDPALDVWLPVPDELSDEQVLLARLVQIASTAVHCARRIPPSVLVFGAGLVGIFAGQVFQASGSEKVAIQDLNPERIERAKRCGLSRAKVGCGLGRSAGVELLDGAADCIVEATGDPALVPAALDSVARLGEVILLGSSRGSGEVNFYKHIHVKGISVIGAHEAIVPAKANASGGISRESLTVQAFAWMRTGRVQTAGLISHRIKPALLAQTYPRLAVDKSNYLGVMVEWC